MDERPYYCLKEIFVTNAVKPVPIYWRLPSGYSRITGTLLLSNLFPNPSLHTGSIGRLWARIDKKNSILIECPNDRIYDEENDLYDFRLNLDQCYCMQETCLLICNSRLTGQYFNHVLGKTAFSAYTAQLILRLEK